MLLVLHPKHKLGYFEDAGWPRKWIDAAEKLLLQRYKESYEGFHPDGVSHDEELGTMESDDDEEVRKSSLHLFIYT